MVQQARARGPTLVLDAGDSLFERPTVAEREREHAKARLILQGMAKGGAAAMGVGDRDLAAGKAFLLAEAKAVGLPLLSSNLVAPDGTRPFQPGLVLAAGPEKVGVFSVFAPPRGAPPSTTGASKGAGAARTEALPDGLTAGDPVAAARAEAERLRGQGASLVVAMVHGQSPVPAEIAKLSGIDLVIAVHDGTGSNPTQPAAGSAFVLGAGQKGRTVARLDLELDGTGPLQDAGASERAAKELAYVESRLADARGRLEKAQTDTEKQSLARIVGQLDGRVAQLRELAAKRVAEGRTLRVESVNLDANVEDVAEIQAMVKKHEEKWPPKPGAH